METLSIDFFGKTENPGLNDVEVGGIEAERLGLIIEEFDSDFGRKYIVLNRSRVT